MRCTIFGTVPQSSGSRVDEAVAVMFLRDLEPSTSADLNFISGSICGKQPHLLHGTRSQEEENHK